MVSGSAASAAGWKRFRKQEARCDPCRSRTSNGDEDGQHGVSSATQVVKTTLVANRTSPVVIVDKKQRGKRTVSRDGAYEKLWKDEEEVCLDETKEAERPQIKRRARSEFVQLGSLVHGEGIPCKTSHERSIAACTRCVSRETRLLLFMKNCPDHQTLTSGSDSKPEYLHCPRRWIPLIAQDILKGDLEPFHDLHLGGMSVNTADGDARENLKRDSIAYLVRCSLDALPESGNPVGPASLLDWQGSKSESGPTAIVDSLLYELLRVDVWKAGLQG
eukprot:scaffold2740_cov418-Prasinococcus_capsulatus_cf.AAC.20